MKKAYPAIFYFLCLASLLPTGAQGSDAPWSMLQHDLFHRGLSSFYGPRLESARAFLSADIDSDLDGSAFPLGRTSLPVVDSDGTVFIAAGDGVLYKITPQGGGTQSSIYSGLEGIVYGSPALSADGTLYVGTTAGKLYALSKTGSLLWEFTTQASEPIHGSPAVSPDGRIYFGTGELKYSAPGRLYCLNDKGIELWTYDTGAVGSSSPAIDPYGTIYICSFNGRIHAVSSSGALLWSYKNIDTISSSPVLAADGTVYITTSTRLLAFDFDLAYPPQWEFTPLTSMLGLEVESGIMGMPALTTAGNIILAAALGDIYAFSPEGKQLWSRTIKKGLLPATFCSSPLVDKGDRLYVRSENTLYSLNAANGFSLEKFPMDMPLKQTEDNFESSPVLGTRRAVYLYGNDGFLHGIGPSADTLSISGSISGPATVSPGDIKVLVQSNPESLFPRTIELYETGVQAGGLYRVPQLYPGRYIVMPVCTNPFRTFEPLFRQVFLFGGLPAVNIDFTLPAAGADQNPYVDRAEASPNPFIRPADSSLHIAATVQAPGPVTWAIDTSALGSLPPDAVAQTTTDNSCSWDIALSGKQLLGPKMLIVSATDTGNRKSRRPVLVDFQLKSTFTDNASFAIEAESQDLDFVYRLFYALGIADNSSGTAARAQSAGIARSGISRFLLRLFNPAGELVSENAVSSQPQEVQIKNPGQGWSVEIINDGGSDVQCDVSSSMAGTGIVFGTVLDSQTGAPITGADIATSSGTATQTQDGSFVLLCPSGVSTLFVCCGGYLMQTKTATVGAGMTVEKNILLVKSTFNDNETGCIFSYLLGPDAAGLGILRDFRDTRLKKTFAGTVLTNKYYRYSPEIISLLAGDPQLRLQLQDTVTALLPSIEGWLRNKTSAPAALPDQKIRASLGALRSKAGPGLAAEIDAALLLMRAQAYFSLLGLAVD